MSKEFNDLVLQIYYFKLNYGKFQSELLSIHILHNV